MWRLQPCSFSTFIANQRRLNYFFGPRIPYGRNYDKLDDYSENNLWSGDHILCKHHMSNPKTKSSNLASGCWAIWPTMFTQLWLEQEPSGPKANIHICTKSLEMRFDKACILEYVGDGKLHYHINKHVSFQIKILNKKRPFLVFTHFKGHIESLVDSKFL